MSGALDRWLSRGARRHYPLERGQEDSLLFEIEPVNDLWGITLYNNDRLTAFDPGQPG